MDEEEIYLESEERMEKSIENLRSELAKIRTGKASPALLDGIKINYYGTLTPLKQMASITTPEPRLLVIQPWDKSSMGEIEKAIQKSDLGINPINDGNIIRIPIPALTEERRKDLVKLVKRFGEECKIAIRNIRREANEKLKKLEKESKISEDNCKRSLDNIQELTDDFIKKVDQLLVKKEKDILEF
ncbi:ribosome recycling factor [candidate division KSB1 bacterium]|nr:MAG: ribosome recycling factor [candidate division KSB1 bacterium]